MTSSRNFKLLHRSIAELRFRMGQNVWNTCDRLHLHPDEHLARSNFKRAPLENLFFKTGKLPDIHATSDEYLSRLRKQVTAIRSGKFDVLGFEGLSWKGENGIEWNRNPVSGEKIPQVWWERIDYQRMSGDPKIIWELNRHQHFVILGMAYHLFREEAYRMEFYTQWFDWLHSNPPKVGINWTSSLELSLRTISWIWAYQLFSHGPWNPPEGDFLTAFTESLEVHGDHIEHNLSYYFSPNTHLTGEALGLLYRALPGFTQIKEMGPIGYKNSSQELEKHVLSDGGYMERSLWYHRYTLEIYLHFYLLCRQFNIQTPVALFKKIEAMGEFLMYASCPDGTYPLIGDDDGGSLMRLDLVPGNDVKGLLSTLAVIFKRGDFKFVSKHYHEQTYWLLGAASKLGDHEFS